MTNRNISKITGFAIALCIVCFSFFGAHAQVKPKFKAVAFYTGRNDLAHISFMHEAHKWFAELGKKYNFTYDSTNNWANMNPAYLKNYQVVLFLDTRPDKPEQRAVFEEYIKNGGGWMGFHFSAFALDHSQYPQNWDWFHNEFLGSGQYVSNTWHPTSAILRIEDKKHPAAKGLPEKITTQPCEWYRWEHDLRKNPDIDIIASVDSSSFPLGTGPKQSEIWHSGYYPIVWSNMKYRMVYFNIGHNAMDYDGGTNKTLSHTFDSPDVSKLVTNTILWLGSGKKYKK